MSLLFEGIMVAAAVAVPVIATPFTVRVPPIAVLPVMVAAPETCNGVRGVLVPIPKKLEVSSLMASVPTAL